MSARALQLAARNLNLDRMPDQQRERLSIFQSALTYRDDRLAGLDAAVLMEVIEHVDPERLPALERATFGFAAPAAVVVTTPNAEYNPLFTTMEPGTKRHPDHRFEWTRAQFRTWAENTARNHGYQVRFLPVGPEHPDAGPPTQLALFTEGSTMTELSIPELSLVLLVGVTGSGKSTFARAHFKPTEVISSDFCRGLVADDENDQSATPAAFEVLRFIVGQRLKAGRLTVVDATNVQPEARRDLVLLAREYDVLPVAIVLDLPERLCAERNAQRPDRDFGPHVIRRQRQQLRRHLKGLSREGFRTVHVLHTPDEVQAATDHPGQAVQRPAPRDRPLRRHRRRARLPGRARAAAGQARLRHRPRRRRPPGQRQPPHAGARSSSATWWTAAPTPRACCAWSWAWWPRGPRSACPATTRPSCSRRCAARTSSAATAWTPRWSSSTPSPRSSAPGSTGSSTA